MRDLKKKMTWSDISWRFAARVDFSALKQVP